MFLCIVAASTVIYGNDLYSTANSTKINEGDAAVEESNTSTTVEGDKSASEKSTDFRFAEWKNAPQRIAPLKSTPLNIVDRKSALERFI